MYYKTGRVSQTHDISREAVERKAEDAKSKIF